MNAEIDISDILPSIRVPTLVLHRRNDRLLRIEEGRYVASRIPGARFVELPGDDHLPFVGDQDTLLANIERFVTDTPHLPSFDRVLSTILHVGIAGQGAAAFFEHAGHECDWFRGRVVPSASDRLVVSFDGPARAIRCATALAKAAERFCVTVRAGLHTGECAVEDGVLTGPPIEIAAAIAAWAAPGEVLVSRTVRDIVGDTGLPFDDRGVHRVGDTGEWRLFKV